MTSRERYPDMPSLLAAVRVQPGLFLGRATITGLHHMMNGIGYAEELHAVPPESRYSGFDIDEFDRWVEVRHNLDMGTNRSYSVAAELAGSDSAGFDLWFDWYSEYVADQANSPIVRKQC